LVFLYFFFVDCVSFGGIMLYMSEKKIKKSGRNFYIPEWVSSVLDAEAERYGGPGVVVSSAIMAFSKLSNEQKAEVVKTFRNEEVERAYLDTQSIVENAAQDEEAGKKRTRQRRSSKESA
jgi:hypothetical protein